MATAISVSATNNSEIDGLLSGVKWFGTITYSFPDASGDYAAAYYGDGEPTTSGFAQAPPQIQAAINYATGLILSYTNAGIQYAGTNGADIMVAQSPAANPTAYAYYPSNVPSGGDIWFGTAYNYSLASLGNYYFMTALHELGHAVGLKHSHETGGIANVAVPSAHDDIEYTVMSYRSYVGGPLTGYTNEAYGYPQTYMANDLLALQTLYGANYRNHSENTVYSWSSATGQEFINGVAQLAPGGGFGSSANRIFETVWDGGGVDTYDLSNYTTNLKINLNPGAASVFSSTQLAYLGNDHYAAGNVYNAYLYNDDPRSYVDGVVGGSGSDTLIGNAIANVLNGGGGDDTITGDGGNDTIIGGSGIDTAVYSGNKANYAISYDESSRTFTISDQRAGSFDDTDTLTGVEYFKFADGTIDSEVFQTFFQPLPSAPNLAQFGQHAGGWASQDHYPRLLTDASADLNGDHRADIIGFGEHGVYTSLATGGGDFSNPSLALAQFAPAAGGWSSQDSYPRMTADVDGNGSGDIVGFGAAGVYVALNDAGLFQPIKLAVTGFGAQAGGWVSQDKYPRLLDDVNGDGKADIVGFGDAGVYVALAQGNGNFAPASLVCHQLGAADGWSSQDRDPRLLADADGDGKIDVIAFGEQGVYVSLNTGSGFGAPSLKLAAFGAGSAAGGWVSQNLYPREVGDVNGDGYPDIVGFGDGAVYVALGDKLGGFQSPSVDIHQFGAAAGGWESQDLYPRLVADVSGDGHADVVGFGANGVYTSLFDDHGASTSAFEGHAGSTSLFDEHGSSTLFQFDHAIVY